MSDVNRSDVKPAEAGQGRELALGGVRSSMLKVLYDEIYERYSGRETECPVATGDLVKARKRIRQVLKAFGISCHGRGFRVLDIGCGLGFTSEVFREMGAEVTAVDLSKVAVEQARKRFPGIDFRCLMFPDELDKEAAFELIWAVDVPGVGVSDSGEIERDFLRSSLRLLSSNGMLVVGWHTDFSGQKKGGWIHWSRTKTEELRRVFRASPALVPQLGSFWLSAVAFYLCRKLKISVPIYFLVRASEWGRKSPED